MYQILKFIIIKLHKMKLRNYMNRNVYANEVN